MGILEVRAKLLPLVKEKANKYNLDYRLLDAIIQAESAYKNFAVRFEDDIFSGPTKMTPVIPGKYARMNYTTEPTEVQLQKFSWGLAQILGATARWLGFQGPMMMLCDSSTNLEWAGKYLAHLRDEYVEMEAIIAAYNAGSPKKRVDGKFVNQEYVDRVLGFLAK